MKKALKILACIVLFIALVGAAAYLYVFRQQEIAVDLIPNEFTYCGEQVFGRDEAYKELVSWLHLNKEGWTLSYVSYVPRQVYRHPAFVVNVMDGGVIVSYKTDSGYPQLIKSIDHGLNMSCAKDS